MIVYKLIALIKLWICKELICPFYRLCTKATDLDKCSMWTYPSIQIYKRTTANGEINWTYYLLVSCMLYESDQCIGLVMHSLILIPLHDLDSEISTNLFFQMLQLSGFLYMYIWRQFSLVVEQTTFVLYFNVWQVVVKIYRS